MNEQDVTAGVAMRLKALREAKGLTVKALGLAVGVTAEHVDQFESGQADVPVSYLAKVAAVCDADLTALLTGVEAKLTHYSVVRAGEGLSVSRRAPYRYKALAFRFHRPTMEPFLVTAPKYEEHELEFNEHNGEEFVYVVEGRLEVRLAKDVIELGVGDSLYFRSSIPHAMRGLGDSPARFVDVLV